MTKLLFSTTNKNSANLGHNYLLRFGTGSGHVLEYTMVTGNGNIILVNKDNITDLNQPGKRNVSLMKII